MNRQEIEEAKLYIRNRVSATVEKLTVDLLINKPKDVVGFMINWLDEKGAKYEAGPAARNIRRPDGVESSDEEEADDVVDEIPIPTREGAVSTRYSVSAEAYGFHNKKESFKARIIPKSPEVKLRIRNLLANIFLFSHLEQKDLDIIVNAMSIRSFEAGVEVIRQGDDGNELFVVEKGKLTCSKKEASGAVTPLRVYAAGDFFGELALMYNTPRAATITTTEKTELLCLDRETFNNIIKGSLIKNLEKYEQFLAEVSVLQTLSPHERSKLCDCLVIKTFQPDEVVIREGEKGDMFFLVIEGRATAFKLNYRSGQKEEVMRYEPKSYFGELALIKDEPRAATVIAQSNLKLGCIDRYAFKRILGPLEDIMRRNAQKYVKF